MHSGNHFTTAIVRLPCKKLVKGITTANLGVPDYDRAVIQHQEYIHALSSCGLNVIAMEADEQYPDSVFIEDPAIVTSSIAIITNPGAPSRKGEVKSVGKQLYDYCKQVEHIKSPGCLDGGDVMKCGSHFYIGISKRTNYQQ